MTRTDTRWQRTATRLFATVTFVALAAGSVLSAQAAPPEWGPRHGGPMMGGPGMAGGPMMGGPMMGGPMAGGPGMMGGMASERMLDAVNATAEQRTQIHQIMDAARADLRAQREATRALHDQARQLFTQPTVDARAAEALRVQKMAAHDQASKRMLQAMLDVSRVLTPEQRTRIGELMAQRRQQMEQRRGRQS